jgi:hypothetical protein
MTLISLADGARPLCLLCVLFGSFLCAVRQFAQKNQCLGGAWQTCEEGYSSYLYIIALIFYFLQIQHKAGMQHIFKNPHLFGD